MPNNHHFGLEKDEERRIQRLKKSPKYDVLSLSVGGYFIAQDLNAEGGALEVADNTEAALEKYDID